MYKNRRSYKYCIVPQCRNTTVTAPDKVFVTLPNNPEVRKLWQHAMRRSDHLSDRTVKYCCEDHFDLENDMQNYMYFKLMGNVPIKLKPGVIPHIFDCQTRVEKFPQDATRKRLIEESSRRYKRLRKAKLGSNADLEAKKGEGVLKEASGGVSKDSEVCKIRIENCKTIQVDIKVELNSKAVQCDILKLPKLKRLQPE